MEVCASMGQSDGHLLGSADGTQIKQPVSCIVVVLDETENLRV